MATLPLPVPTTVALPPQLLRSSDANHGALTQTQLKTDDINNEVDDATDSCSHGNGSSKPPAAKNGLLSHFHNHSACHENRLIQPLCDSGHLDKAMDVLGHMQKSATTDSYLSLLRLCIKQKALSHVKFVSDHLLEHRPQLGGFLGDFLVVALAKCGAVEDAQQIADRLARRTIFSWTAIISAHVNRGDNLKAVKLYECMQKDGVKADVHTFVSLLKACSNLRNLAMGKVIHMDAQKEGMARENLIGNSLVTMYGKCGDIQNAEMAFLDMSHRDIVSWTALLSSYLEQGQSKKALRLFRQMQEEGMTPNHLTCVVALQACVSFAEHKEEDEESARLVSLEIGQALHAYALRKDFAADAFLSTTLINMYGHCGNIEMAENAFDILPQKGVVQYNAMLAAYVEHCYGARALLLFKNMMDKGITPAKLTYVLAIQACSTLACETGDIAKDRFLGKSFAFKVGLALHIDACMEDCDSDIFVETALVTMYGKCGHIEEAEAVFSGMVHHDIVSWTALFSAYVEQGLGEKALKLHTAMQEQHMILDDVSLMLSWTAMLSGFIEKGQGEKALNLYKSMKDQGVLLDDVALKCVLQACCLTGSLHLCRQVHSRIICTGYDGSQSVAATLIHTYGNCGSMVDAQAIFDRLSEPDIVSWSTCIAGHAVEGDSNACFCMLEKLALAKLIPDELTFTSVLVACCHSGQVAKGLEFLESMTIKYGAIPDLKHYGVVLDLLGRAGDLNRVLELLCGMLFKIDLAMWMSLLGACQTHVNVDLARVAFDNVVILQPADATPYIMMSNIYANAGMQKAVAEIKASRQKFLPRNWEGGYIEEDWTSFVLEKDHHYCG